jgi:hypothetical protein
VITVPHFLSVEDVLTLLTLHALAEDMGYEW